MGLWHHRIINTSKSTKNELYSFSLPFLSKKHSFSKMGELGLSLAPYTRHKFYNASLYVQDDIYIAIDGEVDELGYSNILGQNIIDLYKTYGREGLYRLNGQFSLILYDEKKELTLLFRSFFTGNPLYFVTKNNVLSVSTNPIYILRRPDISDDLESEEMNAMFSLAYTELKGNVFSELTSLESGEMVVATPNKIQHIKKPLNEYFVPQHYGSELDVIEDYRSLLKTQINENLLSDASYGIMLSSGMDSSSIAVLAKEILEKKHRNFRAYSWTLPNDTLGDESDNIKALAKALKIPLTLFSGERFGPFDMLEDHAVLPDTPYMNPYRFLVEETYKHAAVDGIDILLNGGYGDLLYFGRDNQLVDIVRDKQFKLFFPEIYSIIKKMGLYNGLKSSPAIRKLLKDFLPVSVVKSLTKPAMIHVPEWLSKNEDEKRRDILSKNNTMTQENKYGSFKFALMPYFLSSMGWERYLSGIHDIKRIDPYQNFKLFNYTSSIPSYMTYRKGQTKYFAREAMRGLLPESIRLQGRAGNLVNFFSNSYKRNKKNVRELLLDDRSIWKKYISELWMEEKLKIGVSLNGNELSILRLCIDIQMWTKAIKPGGSLYEGHFTHTMHDQGLQL